MENIVMVNPNEPTESIECSSSPDEMDAIVNNALLSHCYNGNGVSTMPTNSNDLNAVVLNENTKEDPVPAQQLQQEHQNFDSCLIDPDFIATDEIDGGSGGTSTTDAINYEDLQYYNAAQQNLDAGSMMASESQQSSSSGDYADSDDKRSRGEKRKCQFQTDGVEMIQNRSCVKGAAANRKGLSRCRDCMYKKDVPTIDDVCRFHMFRKIFIRETAGEQKWMPSGFCDPYEDCSDEDIDLWLPRKEPPPDLELNLCKDLIKQLGDQVCSLIRQEKEALTIDKGFGVGRKTYWKRHVEGIREMCDVCVTTLFNFHWICRDCGFVVCLGCFKLKQNGTLKNKIKINDENAMDGPAKDEFGWMLCSSSKNAIHISSELSLTQIIPRDTLFEFGKLLHKARRDWSIPQLCGCPDATGGANGEENTAVESKPGSNGTGNTLFASTTTNDNNAKVLDKEDGADLLASVFDDDPLASVFEVEDSSPPPPIVYKVDEKPTSSEAACTTNTTPIVAEPNKYFVRQHHVAFYDKSALPLKTHMTSDTAIRYPDLPHKWLCDGTLLVLKDPDNEQNLGLFQDLWKGGQPVVVSKVGEKLNPDLWTPEAFSEEYGHETNVFINCMSGKVVKKTKIKEFWDGFVDIEERGKDSAGKHLLLKLKDWPPTEDFAKFSPKRFEDLMKALPLKDYTGRSGRLNLAARLPENFMRPDLGPKMYIAYGDGNNLERGTTNLHLDISDAVNCMVHVGIPRNSGGHVEAVTNAIRESDCDEKTIEQVSQSGSLPGALWHIYRPWDADKIRDLLHRIAEEKNQPIEKDNDPIHDQVWYLNKEIRRRLRSEYNVIGFPIVQCQGDAVFIPAGAPHQVRNLHNCIKIAEDFVSPENVSHCFQLTEEFRDLSDTHTNHEDKLQIKNIVYHAVKDALSVLMNSAVQAD